MRKVTISLLVRCFPDITVETLWWNC